MKTLGKHWAGCLITSDSLPDLTMGLLQHFLPLVNLFQDREQNGKILLNKLLFLYFSINRYKYGILFSLKISRNSRMYISTLSCRANGSLGSKYTMLPRKEEILEIPCRSTGSKNLKKFVDLTTRVSLVQSFLMTIDG